MIQEVFLTDRNPVENRPKIVDEKQRFGDFELDTIIEKNHRSAIVTLSDRSTGLFKIKKVATKESKFVAQAVIELLIEIKPFTHTITSDNEKKFASHK